jgi:hypothetical protein
MLTFLLFLLTGISGEVCNRDCDGGYLLQELNGVKEYMYCNNHACGLEKLECVYSEWSTYNSISDYRNATNNIGVVFDESDFGESKCSVTCGGGFIREYRHLIRTGSDGIEACRPFFRWNICNFFHCIKTDNDIVVTTDITEQNETDNETVIPTLVKPTPKVKDNEESSSSPSVLFFVISSLVVVCIIIIILLSIRIYRMYRSRSYDLEDIYIDN